MTETFARRLYCSSTINKSIALNLYILHSIKIQLPITYYNEIPTIFSCPVVRICYWTVIMILVLPHIFAQFSIKGIARNRSQEKGGQFSMEKKGSHVPFHPLPLTHETGRYDYKILRAISFRPCVLLLESCLCEPAIRIYRIFSGETSNSKDGTVEQYRMFLCVDCETIVLYRDTGAYRASDKFLVLQFDSNQFDVDTFLSVISAIFIFITSAHHRSN